jgi:hypothetical protein
VVAEGALRLFEPPQDGAGGRALRGLLGGAAVLGDGDREVEETERVIERQPTHRHAHADPSGELWIVINDAGVVRWDDAGLFMMKLTRSTWR